MWKDLENLVGEYKGLELEKVIDYEKFSMISIIILSIFIRSEMAMEERPGY